MRCKVRLDNIEKNEDGTAKVVFTPVTTGSMENELFFKFTPWGRIEIGTINEKVVEKLNLGGEYYVDFVEAM